MHKVAVVVVVNPLLEIRLPEALDFDGQQQPFLLAIRAEDRSRAPDDLSRAPEDLSRATEDLSGTPDGFNLV